VSNKNNAYARSRFNKHFLGSCFAASPLTRTKEAVPVSTKQRYYCRSCAGAQLRDTLSIRRLSRRAAYVSVVVNPLPLMTLSFGVLPNACLLADLGQYKSELGVKLRLPAPSLIVTDTFGGIAVVCPEMTASSRPASGAEAIAIDRYFERTIRHPHRRGRLPADAR
jgi:hypothetical protein